MKKYLAASAVLFAFPLFAMAQSSDSMSSGTASTTMTAPAGTSSSTNVKLSMQDTHFIKMASIAGLAEVNDGKLAETMGGASVKTLGTQMVTDHTKANDQLTSLAQQDGVTPPDTVDASHAAVNSKLQKLSGAAFDKEYLDTELTGHEKTIALFKAEASTGSSKDLKSFASDTLPTLEQHLEMIKTALK